MAQERRQRQEQKFRREERVASEAARATEGEKNRGARVQAAKITASGKTSDQDKDAARRKTSALASYREELERIERDATRPRFDGGLKGNQPEIDRRKKAAAAISRPQTTPASRLSRPRSQP